uniref:Uncharacterized protein n=1 Tax=Rhizophora mucronata TaxID=61149 RepID=A0A2P2QF75_RHIMU
MVKKRSVF